MSDKDEKYDLVLNTTILETEVGLMFTVSDEGGVCFTLIAYMRTLKIL